MYFLVSHKYRYLMGWSAKCGCSSVKRWYLDTHGIKIVSLDKPVYEAIGYGDTEYTHVDWKSPEKYREYKKYVTVRNPFSRLVSGFIDKYVLNKQFPNYGWQTFNGFLDALERDKYFNEVEKHHFCPQFSEAFTLFDKAGFTFDNVLQLENLEFDLHKISANRGIPISRTPTANRTKYNVDEVPVSNVADLKISEFTAEKIPAFEYFYTRNNIRTVEKIYKTDFKMLNGLGVDYVPSDAI